MNTFPAPARSVVMVILMLGFLSMFLASFTSLMNNASLFGRPGAVNQPIATRDMPEGEASPPPAMGFNLSGQDGDELSGLMGKLQANSNDPTALTDIGEFFMRTGEWTRAEAFLRKAMLSKPADTRPLYLTGICQFRQGKPQEAAKTFEDLLQIQEDPSAMFNLALLYKHHLGTRDASPTPEQQKENQRMQERARMLLQKVVNSPDAGPDVISWAKEELTTTP